METIIRLKHTWYLVPGIHFLLVVLYTYTVPLGRENIRAVLGTRYCFLFRFSLGRDVIFMGLDSFWGRDSAPTGHRGTGSITPRFFLRETE